METKTTQTQTLFEKLGGEAALDATVNSFYEKVLADDRVNYFFKETDMVKQKQHQKRFLTYAFGGASKYTGKSMHKAHKKARKQGLNVTHFDAICENLVKTLKELGIAQELIDQVVAICMTTKDDILNE